MLGLTADSDSGTSLSGSPEEDSASWILDRTWIMIGSLMLARKPPCARLSLISANMLLISAYSGGREIQLQKYMREDGVNKKHKKV